MTTDRESHAEQIARVRQMAVDEGDTWDLSANDVLALRTVLAERDELLAAVKELRVNANRLCDRNLGGTYEDDCRRSMARADSAIAHAEGRS